jgi:hypothetical protein
LTFTTSEPVKVPLGHRFNIDNKTLSTIDAKEFGDLFLVTPIHPNVVYVSLALVSLNQIEDYLNCH